MNDEIKAAIARLQIAVDDNQQSVFLAQVKDLDDLITDHARLKAVVEKYRDLMRDLSKYAEEHHGEADPEMGTFADSCGLPICGHHIVRPGKTQCECDHADNPLAKLRERWEALAASSEGGGGDE